MLALVVGGSRLRDEVAAALAALPIDVARAADHAAALEALRGASGAIVLCDWSTPDAAATQGALAAACDGLEAALIAVSDESDPARRAAMLAAGAVDVLALPADRARLQMRALHALERARSGVDAQLYRRVFERNPLAMCLIDDNSGRFLAVSDGALVQYGWSREEFLGMLLRDVRPPEMVPAFEEACARPESLVPILTTHWRKDGTRFTSQGLLQRFTVGERRLRFAVSRDVTDEARNAETHRRALVAYQRLVERSADGIFNHRADDFAVTYANPALVAFLGYGSADEIVGRSILDFVDPADADAVRARVGHIVSSRRASPPAAIRFIAADGTLKWAETRGFVGEFDGPVVTVLVRDLTERRHAEEALHRSDRRFAGIFHATPAAISLTRISDGHFLDVNERWVEFTGFQRADVLGRSAADLGLWHDPAARERLYARAYGVLDKDLPGIGLFQIYSIYGANKRLIWRPDAQQSFSV
ncbi:MAG TPA: PAS domain S-box protein, partial [Polyangia bacterium]|nr:PAS domain S-box protein [Polyangia bacterium]